ncbi:MAG: hypothetical protein J3K34DRAFT_426784 [Monoraphidium minutum]|nr:MAG: hypothetical protein J3K34DRAFT_426784 [Monoraphidium minutum]
MAAVAEPKAQHQADAPAAREARAPKSEAAAAQDDGAEGALLARVLAIPEPLGRYCFLRQLAADDPGRYYRLLMAHEAALLPYVYTPTVGAACLEYHTLPAPAGPPRGLVLSLSEGRGAMLEKLRARPGGEDVRVVVMTDGGRILGLGDLGANGMALVEGKSALYTTAGGLDPGAVLPVCLDVGTDNAELRGHPEYKGLHQPRPPPEAFDSWMDDVMAALRAWRPHLLVHFEDFATRDAFRLLERYRATDCVLNDDIQGTAVIVLAGLLSAARASGRPDLRHHRVLFMGAGEAAVGIATLIARYLAVRLGVPEGEARRSCFFVDTHGLVTAARKADLAPHKLPFAHDAPPAADLRSAVAALRPTALVGASAVGGAFDGDVLRLMGEINARPIVFPLSNPTDKAECTFEGALAATGGAALFASGSPMPSHTLPDGTRRTPAQANNAYAFPALGLAAVLVRPAAIPDDMLLAAAEAVAGLTTREDAERGDLFPPLDGIRAACASAAAAVARWAVEAGVAARPEGLAGDGWEAYVAAQQWAPPPPAPGPAPMPEGGAAGAPAGAPQE